MDDKGFLDRVYDLEDEEKIAGFYDTWSKSYDAEVTENGYATPERCAKALAEAGAAVDAPVLDVGCGTGLSGLAFRRAGFTTLDGLDLSADMLAKAAARPGLYRALTQTTLENPMPVAAGTYESAAAVGVLSPSHAPAAMIDAVLEVLAPGGRFVFSLNDHALEDPGYEARIAEWTDAAAAHVLFREHGPHLPKIDLGSVVYVLQKA